MSNGEKQAVTFRPKRQWKPKRRDRNQKRRMKRRRWYRKNRNKIRQKSKRRYKQLRKNPAYKRWQARKRREKTKRKFRQATMVSSERSEEFTIAEGIPEIYFLFDESESTVDVDLGVICDVDPDEDEILVWDLDDGEYKVVTIEDFVEYAVFLEEDDEDNFYTMMENVYEDIPDEDTPDIVQRVAARHGSRKEAMPTSKFDMIRRLAQRYQARPTPTQMAVDDLMLPVSDQRFDRAMSLFAKEVGGQYTSSSGTIHLPWASNLGDKSLPTKIQVLYRKFPCGFLHKELNGESGLPCVSFDMIPNTSNPRRSRIYKSIMGSADEAKQLFAKFLRWAKIVAIALNRYRAERDANPDSKKNQLMINRIAARHTRKAI